MGKLIYYKPGKDTRKSGSSRYGHVALAQVSAKYMCFVLMKIKYVCKHLYICLHLPASKWMRHFRGSITSGRLGSSKLFKHALAKNVTAKQQHQQHVQNSSGSNNAFWPRPNQQQAATTTNETRTWTLLPLPHTTGVCSCSFHQRIWNRVA